MAKINNNKLRKSPLGGFKGLFFLATLLCFNACGDWLDVVPDGVATIDMAFNSRNQTLKYLATCYSYMPRNGRPDSDPAMLGSDEMCTYISHSSVSFSTGMQNATNPYFNSWGSLYQGLRDCNTFMENVDLVPDLPDWERDQWIAEVKVLKAYYHFCLVQRYGPVPVIRENIPVSDNISAVRTVREPVDDCFQYIVELIDEATAGNLLPDKVFDVSKEMGRITKPIALAIKAKILVTAASPLFNGNNDQATLRNHDGTPLFNVTYDGGKWQKAMEACRIAIDACHRVDVELYEFPNTGVNRLTDTIVTQMSLRNAFTLRWNSDIIWANTQSLCTGGGANDLQTACAPALNPAFSNADALWSMYGVPLKIAEKLFYSHHGIPMAEDKTRNLNELYDFRTAQVEEKLHVAFGSTTVDMHFDREPRFYAWVGFDNGIWYGQGRTDDKGSLWVLHCKNGETDNVGGRGSSVSGYYPKKFTPYTNVLTSRIYYSTTPYPWPLIRLSDLYLLYAEAINEVDGPTGANSAEMFQYIDRVRARAGLKGVKESWDQYAYNPKYNTKEGMRDIIRQERLIELFLEGQRFWDIRRWKTALEEYQTPIQGWNLTASQAVPFYTARTLYIQKFGTRDYFWPIRNSDIDVNPNLVQNIGW